MAKGPKQLEIGIVSGRVYPEFAEQVAAEVGVEMIQTDMKDHGNSEQYARYAESIRSKDLFIFQAHAATPGRPIDVAIAEQRMLINAARLADAARINVVFPYAGYSRQDRKARSGEPIAGADVIKEFVNAGAHRLLTVDLHSGQLQAASEVPFDHMTAQPTLVSWLRKNWVSENGRKHVTLVAPDAGRAKDVARAAEKMNVDFAVIDKRRDRKTGDVVVKNVLGDIKGRHCMIWDDMIDGAGTIKTGAEALWQRDAASIGAICTHAIFSGQAVNNLKEANFSQVVVTDSLPQPEDIDNLVVVRLAKLMGKAVTRIHQGESLSALFNDENLS